MELSRPDPVARDIESQIKDITDNYPREVLEVRVQSIEIMHRYGSLVKLNTSSCL
jgi:hypothetical protein